MGWMAWRMRNSRLPALLGCALVLVLLVAAAPGCRPKGAVVGKPAPAGTLTEMATGGQVDFPADFRDRAVMLSFFSPG